MWRRVTAARGAALLGWLHHYNWHRNHGSLQNPPTPSYEDVGHYPVAASPRISKPRDSPTTLRISLSHHRFRLTVPLRGQVRAA